MEIILERELEHQQKAIDAVSGVFADINIKTPLQFYENPTVDLTDSKLDANISNIQNSLNVHSTL